MLSENFIHCCGSGELSSTTINAVEFIFGSWLFSCIVEGGGFVTAVISSHFICCRLIVTVFFWSLGSFGGRGGLLEDQHGCKGCGLLMVLLAQEWKTHCNSSSYCQPSHQPCQSTYFSFLFFTGGGFLLPGLWTMVEMTAVGLPGETLYFQEQCHLLLVQTVVTGEELRKVWLV